MCSACSGRSNLYGSHAKRYHNHDYIRQIRSVDWEVQCRTKRYVTAYECSVLNYIENNTYIFSTLCILYFTLYVNIHKHSVCWNLVYERYGKKYVYEFPLVEQNDMPHIQILISYCWSVNNSKCIEYIRMQSGVHYFQFWFKTRRAKALKPKRNRLNFVISIWNVLHFKNCEIIYRSRVVRALLKNSDNYSKKKSNERLRPC